VDVDGYTDERLRSVCKEFFEAGDPEGPGNRLPSYGSTRAGANNHAP